MRKYYSILLTLLSLSAHVCAQQVNITGVSQHTLCYGNIFTVDYTITGSYSPGNIFTVELSNSMGNFASGTQTIGSLTGNTGPGTIVCTVPTGITPATQYRVRINTSAPFTASQDNGTALEIKSYALPQAAASDTPVCEGTSLKLRVLNPYANVSYEWLFPDGVMFQPGQEITLPVTLTKAGRYVLRTYYFGCVAYDTTNPVTVKPRAAKPVITIPKDTLCSGETLHLSALSSTPGASYRWTGPDNFTSFSKDTSITKITTDATGYYKVIAIKDCPSLPDSQHVLVRYFPPVNAANNSPLCEGAGLYITSNDSTPGMTYQWTGPGGFIMSSNDTSIINAIVFLSGSYILTASMDSCSVTDTTTVLVNPYPVKPVANSNAPVCSGDTLRLYAAGDTANVSYTWQGPQGYHSAIQNPVIDSSHASGNYIVKADKKGCAKYDTASVVIKPAPAKPEIATNSPVVRGQNLIINVTNPLSGGHYIWKGPVNISDTTARLTIPGIDESYKGVYIVTVSQDGCSSADSVTIDVLVPLDTGVFILYPNPNNGNFTIEGYTERDQGISISVHNAWGQFIYREMVPTKNNILLKNISLTASSGVYFLRLYADGKKLVFPFSVTGR